jgi:hypothetical protein
MCFVSDIATDAWVPACKTSSGKRVGIVGAGPTGLATAFYLAIEGHRCEIHDSGKEPGGMLRHAVPETKLPRSVLDAEIARIRDLGVEFYQSARIGRDAPFEQWAAGYDAIVLAIGRICGSKEQASALRDREQHHDPAISAEIAEFFGVSCGPCGIPIDFSTMRVGSGKIYSGGDAARFHRQCARAVGDGRKIATSIAARLSGAPFPPMLEPLNCFMGRLTPEEIARFAKRASNHTIIDHGLGDMRLETARCMDCDCARKDDCALRDWGWRLGANPRRWKSRKRPIFSEDRSHPLLVFEPEKCIRCGICIRLSEIKREPVGLSFIGRGERMLPSPPLGASFAEALTISPLDYAQHCPTAAIARKRD